jgi:hypothetical protein
MAMRFSRRAAAFGATFAAAFATGEGRCECPAETSRLLGCSGASIRSLSAQGADERPMSASDFDRWAASTPQSIAEGGLDRAFGAAVAALARFSGQRPDLVLYEGDEIAPSAFANRLSRFPNTTGTVILHKAKVRELLYGDPNMRGNGDIAVVMILAHEFAHIAQFNSPYFERLVDAASCSVLLTELHADFMAGFYLAEVQRRDPRITSQFAVWLMTSIADKWPRGEHGMSEHRLEAASAGYDLGVTGQRDYAAALQQGADFVQRRFSSLIAH